MSERLERIASYIAAGETVADIGSDHGLLPIHLWESGKSPRVIISDIGEGPLLRAKINTKARFPNANFDLRRGNGLESVGRSEVDAVVIAGVGGRLIIDILSADADKTKSFFKYVFQPRNAADKLRKWLISEGFFIYGEALAREGRHICEITAVLTGGHNSGGETGRAPAIGDGREGEYYRKEMRYEISPLLFEREDPLLAEWIGGKIKKELMIAEDIEKLGKAERSRKAGERAEIRLETLRRLRESISARAGNL
jgi:tRNA (adenine22-N1)-methyltransferase